MVGGCVPSRSAELWGEIGGGRGNNFPLSFLELSREPRVAGLQNFWASDSRAGSQASSAEGPECARGGGEMHSGLRALFMCGKLV